MKILGPLLILFLICSNTFADRRECAPCTEEASDDGCVSTGKLYCGTVCYDPSFQHCKMCGGNPIIYSGDEPTCCGTIVCGGNLLCCLGKCYDPTTQVCCRERGESSACNMGIFGGPTCCGSECDYPNDSTTLCCNDAPSGGHYLVGLGLSCCHGVGYDPTEQVCCNGPEGGYTRPLSEGCGSNSSAPSH